MPLGEPPAGPPLDAARGGRKVTPDPSVYSHRLRTALVLTGAGTAGAYHAGVLRALHESSIRLDLVAGDGIGAIGAIFAAVDGASALTDADGLWRGPHVRSFYRRRGIMFGRTLDASTTKRTEMRRRAREPIWRRVLGSPLDAHRTTERLIARLWTLISGGTASQRPSNAEVGARAAELIRDNLGQPGFRELLLTVHDLDAQRDLAFGLVAERYRRDFFHPRDMENIRRSADTFDLTGQLRERLVDVLIAALRIPLLTDPHVLSFPVDSPWRGESHHLVQRPGSVVRLIEEVGRAGAEQILLVSASPEPIGPHSLRAPRTDRLGRFGEHLMSGEAAALRDVEGRHHRARVLMIRPAHNPVGPFDFSGAYDQRSDRRHALDELLQRGYEDGLRQIGAEMVEATP